MITQTKLVGLFTALAALGNEQDSTPTKKLKEAWIEAHAALDEWIADKTDEAVFMLQDKFKNEDAASLFAAGVDSYANCNLSSEASSTYNMIAFTYMEQGIKTLPSSLLNTLAKRLKAIYTKHYLTDNHVVPDVFNFTELQSLGFSGSHHMLNKLSKTKELPNVLNWRATLGMPAHEPGVDIAPTLKLGFIMGVSEITPEAVSHEPNLEALQQEINEMFAEVVPASYGMSVACCGLNRRMVLEEGCKGWKLATIGMTLSGVRRMRATTPLCASVSLHFNEEGDDITCIRIALRDDRDGEFFSAVNWNLEYFEDLDETLSTLKSYLDATGLNIYFTAAPLPHFDESGQPYFPNLDVAKWRRSSKNATAKIYTFPKKA